VRETQSQENTARKKLAEGERDPSVRDSRDENDRPDDEERFFVVPAKTMARSLDRHVPEAPPVEPSITDIPEPYRKAENTGVMAAGWSVQ